MRKRHLKTAVAIVMAAALLLPAFLLSGAALAALLTWEQANAPGFGIAVPSDNLSTFSMAEYNGSLYAGTFNDVTGCQVWRFDGPDAADWTKVSTDGFGDANNIMATHMAVYKGLLYVGTGNGITGAEVWSFDGTNWLQVNTDGFGDANNNSAAYLIDFGGMLLVGSGKDGYFSGSTAQARIFAYNGTTWTQANTDGFGEATNQICRSMAVLGGQLYAGTQNKTTGCEVWRFDGPTAADWTKVANAGLLNVDNVDARSLAVYNNYLYLGVANSADGTSIFRYDGPDNWTRVDPGTWVADATRVMLPYGGELYVALGDDDTGCEVWAYDGTAWDQRGENGFGDIVNNQAIHSMVIYSGYLWAGVGNSGDPGATGCGVWRTYVPPTWYLAEGATAGDFETYVLVQNPNAGPVTVDVNFMTGAGPKPGPQDFPIPANSRVTFKANDYVTDFNVSTMVTSVGGGVICERSMYGNNRTWAHDSIGVTDPAFQWYLAEGATAGDFETYVLAQNPNDTAVTVSLDFMTGAGPKPGPQDYPIPANSRVTFKANDYVTDFNVSTLVTSVGGGVICERAMYGGDRTWGTDSIGTPSPAYDWYLAEGATAGDFETYVLVQNPQDAPVIVDVNFMTGDGAKPGPQDYPIPANSRVTFKANDYVTDFNVSTEVVASMPVIAERSMYGNNRTWAHDSIGTDSLASIWFLAEGATAGGFETYVLAQNPNPTPVTVYVYFETGAGPEAGPQDVVIPGNSRVTFKANDYVTDFNVSTVVASAGGPIICERAMYGGDRTWGTDSIGYTP